MYFFFFNDTATTEIYTLSLHDALPILTTIISTVAYSIFEGKKIIKSAAIATNITKNLMGKSVDCVYKSSKTRKAPSKTSKALLALFNLSNKVSNISYFLFSIMYKPYDNSSQISIEITKP